MLAGCTTVWFRRRSPRPSTVRFWRMERPIGLRTSVILTFAIAGCSVLAASGRRGGTRRLPPDRHLLQLDTAKLRDLVRGAEALQRLQCRPGGIDRVRGAEGFGQNVP